MKKTRYWFTHPESDSVWIDEERDVYNEDGLVCQHREARDDENDDEEGKAKFMEELKSQSKCHI